YVSDRSNSTWGWPRIRTRYRMRAASPWRRPWRFTDAERSDDLETIDHFVRARRCSPRLGVRPGQRYPRRRPAQLSAQPCRHLTGVPGARRVHGVGLDPRVRRTSIERAAEQIGRG